MSVRKTMREKLREQVRGRPKQEQIEGFTGLMKLLVAGHLPVEERVINPTQAALWADSTSKEKAYMGAAGVAKTSTGVAEILGHALLEPGTKYLIARQDYNDLLDTTYQRFETMMSYLPADTIMDRSSRPPLKVWLKPVTWTGMKDELSQITFMGLKGGLGSFEANGAFVDEADQADMHAVKEILGRLRWMKGHRWVTVAFNPPPKTHWLYNACTGLNEHDEPFGQKTYTLYVPQPEENKANLPSDYYDVMRAGMPEDMVQRLVRGEWGSTFPGERVVREFNRALHVQYKLPWEHGTLLRFWDFGYNRPCVLFARLTREGRLLILKEFLGHKLFATEFIERVRGLTEEWFPTVTSIRDFGDPAVAQKKDTGQMLAHMHSAGIQLGFQHTPFDVSLSAMRQRFSRLVEGQPAILIDSSCGILIGGLEGGYCFKNDGITPRKDGYYDHLVDALRYGCWNIFGTSTTFGFNPYLQGTPQMASSPTSTVDGLSMAYWDGKET